MHDLSPRLARTLIYLVAAVGCGLAVGANSPEHSWLMTLLGAAAMTGVLYVLARTS
jgi:hypothetical protein